MAVVSHKSSSQVECLHACQQLPLFQRSQVQPACGMSSTLNTCIICQMLSYTSSIVTAQTLLPYHQVLLSASKHFQQCARRHTATATAHRCDACALNNVMFEVWQLSGTSHGTSSISRPSMAVTSHAVKTLSVIQSAQTVLGSNVRTSAVRSLLAHLPSRRCSSSTRVALLHKHARPSMGA
jgi:hypothetical protein